MATSSGSHLDEELSARRWSRGRSETRMPRINVTGNAGVGKSTLAARIAVLLDAPLFGLDAIVWKPGWKKSAPAERIVKERELCARSSWVIDGVSRFVRESADVIVFLDYPRRVSYWRCAKRNWRYLFKSRPGLPPACSEIRIVPTLARIIWQFPRNVRPALLAEFEQWKGQKTLIHIRSDRELGEFMRRLEEDAPSCYGFA
jgi:adenylate kinase family enzyme